MLFYFMVFVTYGFIAWAIALPEPDGHCQSGEKWSAHLAAWGLFIGLLVRGTWHLILTMKMGTNDWPVSRMLADTAWGILNCIFSALLVHAFGEEPRLWPAWLIPLAFAFYQMR